MLAEAQVRNIEQVYPELRGVEPKVFEHCKIEQKKSKPRPMQGFDIKKNHQSPFLDEVENVVTQTRWQLRKENYRYLNRDRLSEMETKYVHSIEYDVAQFEQRLMNDSKHNDELISQLPKLDK